MRKSLSDIFAGLGFLALALVFRIQLGDLSGISRVFPLALIILVGIGGVYFIIKGLYLLFREKAQLISGAPDAAPLAKEVNPTAPTLGDDKVAWRRVFIISVLSIGYALALLPVGFFATTFSFLFLAVVLLGDRSEERRVGKECLRLCSALWPAV